MSWQLFVADLWLRWHEKPRLAKAGDIERARARVAERFGLSARGYHRVLRVARTIADLAGSAEVRKPHVAEAVSYRLSVQAGR